MTDKILLDTDKARAINIGDSAVLLQLGDRVDSGTAAWAAEALQKLEGYYNAVILAGGNGYDIDEIQGLSAQQDWAALEEVARRFQSLAQAIRKSPMPVVMALTGQVTAFGIELGLAADSVCSADAVFSFEIRKNRFTPVAGGLAELTLRTYDICAAVAGSDVVPFFKRISQQMIMGKPCEGLAEAATKGIAFNMASSCCNEELINKAKEKALFLAAQGYVPCTEWRTALVTGKTGTAALEIVSVNMQQGGFLSSEMLGMAADIARVFGGGDVPKGAIVPETQLLLLEREAFLNACKRQGRKEAAAV